MQAVSVDPPLLTFFLSRIEPLPRTMILQPVSDSNCLVVIPRGPNIRPTKLNWNKGESGMRGGWRGRLTFFLSRMEPLPRTITGLPRIAKRDGRLLLQLLGGEAAWAEDTAHKIELQCGYNKKN